MTSASKSASHSQRLIQPHTATTCMMSSQMRSQCCPAPWANAHKWDVPPRSTTRSKRLGLPSPTVSVFFLKALLGWRDIHKGNMSCHQGFKFQCILAVLLFESSMKSPHQVPQRSSASAVGAARPSAGCRPLDSSSQPLAVGAQTRCKRGPCSGVALAPQVLW